MTDLTDFEPPKYTPQEEYAPVDIFDIPARQKALAQPTELRPYNGFTLLGLWLSIIGFFIVGLSTLTLWFAHSSIFWIVLIFGIVDALVFGIPAAVACLIGLYQVSFAGFEKGKAVSWLGLILAVVQVAFGVVACWLVTTWVITAIEIVQKTVTDLQNVLS